MTISTLVLSDAIEHCALHLQVAFAPAADEWKVLIVVADFGAHLTEQFDNRERWRLGCDIRESLTANQLSIHHN